MIGEFLCLIAYYTSASKAETTKEKSAPNYVFMVACCLDWTATTLVNMAYVLIAASIVQMTRGAIVIFTCFLSVVFLGRRQQRFHIAGVTLVFLGITLVSLSAFINPTSTTSTTSSGFTRKLTGIALCLGAQVFQASMLVYEEKVMSKYTVPPLYVVGMEGAFGILFGVLLLSFLNVANVESTPAALYQMQHSGPLAVAVIGSIFSIAFFNYSGVTVTQRASAVSRSTIDVSRTVLIWVVELALVWNTFSWMQLVGFVVLVAGTLVYNELLIIPGIEPQKGETEQLVSHTAKDD